MRLRWPPIIMAYARLGLPLGAIRLYHFKPELSAAPDNYILVAVLKVFLPVWRM